MSEESFEIRSAREEDRYPLALLFAAVAEERDGIATEPPVDVEAWAANWRLEGTFVAVAADDIVGSLSVEMSRFASETGMAVAPQWRGQGVGSALLAAAIVWARERGLHKLTLSVVPHNAAAIALYHKFGFIEEGAPREAVQARERRALGCDRDGVAALIRTEECRMSHCARMSRSAAPADKNLP